MLKTLLDDSDVDATDVIDKMEPMLAGTEHQESFNAISAAVEEFAFDDALELVTVMEEEFCASVRSPSAA